MKYEMLYIVPQPFSDAEVTGVMERVAEMVKKAGGEVTRHEILARIKLAYPIKNTKHGTYVLLHLNIAEEAINEFDRQVGLFEEILRHQILVLPKGAENKKYDMVAYVAPLSEEAPRRDRETPAPTPHPKPVAAAVPAKADESTFNMAELDKKLDEILEADANIE